MTLLLRRRCHAQSTHDAAIDEAREQETVDNDGLRHGLCRMERHETPGTPLKANSVGHDGTMERLWVYSFTIARPAAAKARWRRLANMSLSALSAHDRARVTWIQLASKNSKDRRRYSLNRPHNALPRRLKTQKNQPASRPSCQRGDARSTCGGATAVHPTCSSDSQRAHEIPPKEALKLPSNESRHF